MSIVDMVRAAWETNPALVATVTGGAIITGATGIAIRYTTRRNQRLQQAQYQVIEPRNRDRTALPNTPQEESEDDDYPAKDIDALLTLHEDTDCTIKGAVKQFLRVDEANGYTGRVANATKSVPFFYDDDKISYTNHMGLLRLIMDDAIRTGNVVTMRGTYQTDSKIFECTLLQYELDGTKHEI